MFDASTAAADLAQLYTWGVTIPPPAVDAALDCPAPSNNLPHDQWETINLLRLDRRTKLIAALLEDHKILAIHERGSLRLVRSQDQVQVARDRRFTEIDKQLRALTLEIAHLNIIGLSNSEVSAQHDAAAQTDALRRALNAKSRRLKHQLPAPVATARRLVAVKEG